MSSIYIYRALNEFFDGGDLVVESNVALVVSSGEVQVCPAYRTVQLGKKDWYRQQLIATNSINNKQNPGLELE